jgi:hypothetical protein
LPSVSVRMLWDLRNGTEHSAILFLFQLPDIIRVRPTLLTSTTNCREKKNWAVNAIYNFHSEEEYCQAGLNLFSEFSDEFLSIQRAVPIDRIEQISRVAEK